MTPELAQQAEQALQGILDGARAKDPDRPLLKNLVGTLAAYNQIAVPTVEQQVSEKPRDPVQETFDLLAKLREPSAQELKALKEKIGYTFVTTIEAKSLARIQEEKPEYLGFVNPFEGLRSYTPPADFIVAINPNMVRIARSNNSLQAKQLRMTEDYSKKAIEPIVPKAKAIMLPATGITQADINYQIENGRVLIPDFFVRALDTTSGSRVAYVGRYRPDARLRVGGWDRDYGYDGVWAFPAVVFLRK